jgi:DNA-directed RNA polymerase subunit RPC12/RpoP
MAGDKQTGRLVFAPVPADSLPDRARVVAYLQEKGIVGAPLKPAGDEAFLIGDGFLQQITFMGCSPHIELEPPADGGSFCHVRLTGPLPAPVLLHGVNTQPPRCAHCRKRLPDWRERLREWSQAPQKAHIVCPHCGREQNATTLGWRQSAGAGRLFIQVEDVFPGEAVPVSGFLLGLEKATGCAWQYFYIRD